MKKKTPTYDGPDRPVPGGPGTGPFGDGSNMGPFKHRPGTGRLLLIGVLVAALSSMLAGCPPPPHRALPPSPPKPPGAFVLPSNNFGNLQV